MARDLRIDDDAGPSRARPDGRTAQATPDPGARGPHPVGVIQLEVTASDAPHEIDRRLPTEVWYPAAPGQEERAAAPHPLDQPHRASPELSPLRNGARALLAFSHGNSGMRQQSTFLMTHLASWGFVVAAPDHLGNTFNDMIRLESDEARREAHLRARRQRPGDLQAVLRSLLDEEIGADLLPPLDATRVGVLGHSFGGWTALKLPALEPRVGAACALAPASEPFIGRRAFDGGELPLPERVATLLLAARDDVLVDLATSIEPLHERLGPHARLEVIDAADHFHFCDGLELLHELHENTPRPNLQKPVRPGRELRGETEMHDLLNERVTRFFWEALFANDSRSRS
mgnify:CR=1 FL=1